MNQYEMIKKLGKEGFKRAAVHSQHGITGAQLKEKRRWGTNIKARMCKHGTWVIDNYEYKGCDQCHDYKATKPPDFRPNFNIGLGCWVESRSQEKAIAKSKGLMEAG